MNARQILSRPRLLGATALLALAGAANAGGVSWSVGVNAPVIYGPGQVSAVVSGGRGYHYAPPPVYVQPPVVVQQPYVQQSYYGAQPVLYQAPPPPLPLFRPFLGWGRWHHHGRAEAYADGYRQGYERGHGDDRREDWDRPHGR